MKPICCNMCKTVISSKISDKDFILKGMCFCSGCAGYLIDKAIDSPISKSKDKSYQKTILDKIIKNTVI